MKKEIQKKLFSLNSLLLITVLLAGFFFRFYNTPERYGFDKDPARDGVIAHYGAQNLHFPLTGPHSGVGEFAFGPWYYYQLIASDIIIPLDYAPWIYLGIVSLIFVYIMYEVGKALKDKKLGLVLAFFAALSPSITGPTSGLSNPNFIPFFTSLFILITIKYLKDKIPKWQIFAWGGIFAIGISHHYQMAGLIFLPLLTLIYKRKKLLTSASVFISGVVALSIPTIIFEYLNNWYNTQGLWKYITQGGQNIYVPNSWTIYIRDFWFSFFSYVAGVPQLIGVALLIAASATIAYFFLKRKLSPSLIIIFATLAINVLLLRWYSGQREYYYTLYLIPLLFVFIGYFFYSILKIRMGTIIILVLIGFMTPFILQADWERLGTRADHVTIKKEANTLMSAFPDNNITVYACGDYEENKIYGVNYFLSKAGRVDDEGIMVGYRVDNCDDTDTYPEIDNTQSLEFAQPQVKDSWKKVTPETIYNDTTNWWTHD